MDTLATLQSLQSLGILQSLGLEMPSLMYIEGAILFGILGMVANFHGKKRKQLNLRLLGWSLMLFVYGVSQTWALYAIGAVLCAAVWWEWGKSSPADADPKDHS